MYKNLIFSYNHLELNVIPSHQYFQCICQLTYQLKFFYTYNFHNLNILQHDMIHHIHIKITWIPNKFRPTHSFVNEYFAFTSSAFIIIPLLFIVIITCIKSIFTLTSFMPFYVCCFISF